MTSSRLATYALGLSAAAALMTGCNGGTGSWGLTPGAFSSARTVSINSLPAPALDNDNKKNGLYQYASNFPSDLIEFDYPKSDSSIGTITNISPGGECADILYGAAKRDFWVTVSGAYQVAEFAVGGKKPIKTLSFGSSGEASACAMDPTTGNLAALTNVGVVIFENASGSGSVVTIPLTEAFFDGYDNHGNLFADGFNGSGKFQLVELPKGSSAFQNITTSNTVGFPGAVQYDGKYITVTDQLSSAVYGYACRATSCTLKRTVSLSGASDCVQTWIGVGTLFCPDAGNLDVEVYKYPAGGSSVATLTANFYLPTGFVEVRK